MILYYCTLAAAAANSDHAIVATKDLSRVSDLVVLLYAHVESLRRIWDSVVKTRLIFDLENNGAHTLREDSTKVCDVLVVPYS